MGTFKPRSFVIAIVFIICYSQESNFGATIGKSEKPVRIDPSNRFFFLNTDGKPLMLIGDYTWETFSSIYSDYGKMFKSLRTRGLNLARVWLWWGCEQFPPPAKDIHIEPFLREGPGIANDGKPKYNLDKFNPLFFERLTDFCKRAEENGICLQLMMMDAWMIKHDYLWKLNAFNRNNNINGVNGDPGGTGKGTDGNSGFCSMNNPGVIEYQKAYIKKVVETVNKFNRIYFEIANENYYNEEWELMLCDYIKDIEKSMPNQHMTIRRDFPSHSYVVQKWDPAVVHKGITEKRNLNVPLLFDTDWTINMNDDQVRKAMWAAVSSGAHFSYMDDAMNFYYDSVRTDRRAVLHGQIDIMAGLMKRLKPWELIPDDNIIKAGVVFAMINKERMFAYLPVGGEVMIDISQIQGIPSCRWFNPVTGRLLPGPEIKNKSGASFSAPDKNDWALLINYP